ncbi:MAG: FAD-dependent oxidoreductase [Ekhidna sp.]|nr:FAD-dependent oxidoreductase [Ekhidna sp.]
MNKSDVIVIGGGIIGLSCAYYLTKEGKAVTIIDKGPAFDASSHANCGLVSPSHALPLNSPQLLLKATKWLFQSDSPFYIRPQINPQFVTWMVGFALNVAKQKVMHSMHGRNQLLMASRKLYDHWFEEEQLECNWSKAGIIFVFKHKKTFENYQLKDEQIGLLDPALKALPLTGDALFKKEPALNETVHGGWWYEIDASLKPDELVRSLKVRLGEMGVNFSNETSVIDFDLKGGEIDAVKTNRGDFRGDYVVLATGAWSPLLTKRLKIKLPIIPGKGYSLTMNKPGISPSMPCIMEEKKVVATPWNESYRLGGTMEFAGYNATMNRVRFRALKKAAEIYLKNPYTDHVTEEWFGWRPMTNNGLPVIDFSDQYKNLVFACGHSMLGLSMAPSTGKLVSEMIIDKETHINPSFYKLRGNLN